MSFTYAKSRDEAARLSGAPAVLGLDGQATRDTGDPGEESRDERVAWLTDAIRATLAAIDQRRGAYTELYAARHGSWDYDWATDMIAWQELAFVTLEALNQERDRIVVRERMRAETHYADD